MCAFYEVVAQSKEAAAGQDPHAAQQFFVQFITRYLHADGTSRARVTTFTRRCALQEGCRARCWKVCLEHHRHAAAGLRPLW